MPHVSFYWMDEWVDIRHGWIQEVIQSHQFIRLLFSLRFSYLLFLMLTSVISAAAGLLPHSVTQWEAMKGDRLLAFTIPAGDPR